MQRRERGPGLGLDSVVARTYAHRVRRRACASSNSAGVRRPSSADCSSRTPRFSIFGVLRSTFYLRAASTELPASPLAPADRLVKKLADARSASLACSHSPYRREASQRDKHTLFRREANASADR